MSHGQCVCVSVCICVCVCLLRTWAGLGLLSFVSLHSHIDSVCVYMYVCVPARAYSVPVEVMWCAPQQCPAVPVLCQLLCRVVVVVREM